MRKHTIDVVFSLSLFMVFVICSFLLLLFQINGYHDLQYDSNNLHTAASFLQTELRHQDRVDQVQITEIEGTPCLKVEHPYGVNYYYVYQGNLMQSSQSAELQVTPAHGEKRFACDKIALSMNQDCLTITLTQGEEQVVLQLRFRSGGISS